MPRKTPYVPQIGDEVIYFLQGHLQYVAAVKEKKVYDIDPEKNQPWHKMPHIRVSCCYDFLLCNVCKVVRTFNYVSTST